MSHKNLTKAIQIIKNAVKNMPSVPGIYRMIDDNGNTLYVGKAKNLAKRVANYSHPERLEYRLQSMIVNTVKIDFTITNTEAEALLLEANLIKKFEPKYNILLKDDKSYPYILITENHDYPRITKHRNVRKVKGKYYGPFASAGAVNKSIADLQKAFLIRPCTDSFFMNRNRPCMEYQIKRCSAPCVNKISQDEYAKLVRQAKDFLDGKSRQVQENLVALMEKESASKNYEKAAIYRDRIKALNKIQAKQNVNINTIGDADVIGLYSKNGQCCIQVCFFRAGQNLGNKPYYPKHTQDQSDSDILTAFIGQFYGNNNLPPKEIIISDEISGKKLLQDALTSIANHKVKITKPKLGDKKELVDNVIKNAKEALEQKMLGKLRQKQLLEELRKLFNLPSTPKRIEVYDNSHISGTSPIGAMIVAGEDGFNKKAYRRFNIRDKNIKAGDDYAMMEEVLTRRFKRLKQDCPDKKPGIWPDLVLIDGGVGHMGVVQNVFEKFDIKDDVIFACISKGPDRNAGREQFHMAGRDSFTLPKTAPAMYYLQVLRDEAHRFAIGSHRIKRSKSVTKSLLDGIPDIGAKRKKALLNHFGSVDDIADSSIKDLEKVTGISTTIAKKIYDYLNEQV